MMAPASRIGLYRCQHIVEGLFILSFISLKGGVVLPWVAEESSGPTTTNLDGAISCNKFQLERSDTR